MTEPNDTVSINTIIEFQDAVFYENRLKSSKDLESNNDSELLPSMSTKNNDPIEEQHENNEPIDQVKFRISK